MALCEFKAKTMGKQMDYCQEYCLNQKTRPSLLPYSPLPAEVLHSDVPGPGMLTLLSSN